MAAVTATPLYAGLLGLMLVFLSFRVVQGRMKYKVGFGDGGNPEMMQRIRVQANFAEYAPMILLALLVAELAGVSTAIIHALGVATMAGRVMHAFGLGTSTGASTGRYWGTVLTWFALLAAAALYLLAAFGLRV